MIRTKARKNWICTQYGKTIEKGTIHEVVEREARNGYWNKPARFHDNCYKVAVQEASDRTQARWAEEIKNGKDPFKLIR